MNLCSEGHEEVCYEDRLCPICQLIDEKDSEIEDLREKIETLEYKLTETETEDI